MAFLQNVFALLRGYWYFRNATQYGKRIRVWGNLVVENKGKMMIGDRVRIVSTPARTELIANPGGTLEIGNSVFINYGCSFAANQKIVIGSHCSIGPHTIIMYNNYHRLEPERRNEMPESAPVVLEENVWLGARVIILPGVRIGTGSVIGAGSVVTRDIPPRVVAAGLPARVIKTL